ncbi:MAG: PilN domain-containing protein [Desulfobacterales bacterium]
MLFTAAIGIEVSDQQVRIICLKKHLNTMRLVGADKCLLDADRPLNEKVEDISGFINEFLKTHRISAADIYIGIPSERIIFREIELPMAVKENLAGTLAYEMEKYVPLSADELYYDFQIIAEDKAEEMLTLSLAVVKRQDLDAYLQIAATLDLPVSGISPWGSGIANSFMQGEKGNGASRVVAFADRERLDMAVIQGQTLVYTKTLSGDEGAEAEKSLSAQTKALLDRFGTPDAQAPVYLHAMDPDEETVRVLSEAGPEAYQGVKPVGLDLPENEFIPAYGLALQAFEGASARMNLMPAELRKKPNKTPLYIMYGLFGCLLLAVLLWGGVFVAKQQAMLHHLDRKIAELETETREVERLRKDIEELQSRIHRLESLRPGNAYVLNVLMELTRRIPENAWIRDLSIKGNEVNIFGAAASASDLVPALDASPLFHGVEFTSSIRKTRDNQELYRIGLQFYQEESK